MNIMDRIMTSFVFGSVTGNIYHVICILFPVFLEVEFGSSIAQYNNVYKHYIGCFSIEQKIGHFHKGA